MSSETISYPHLEREQQQADAHLLPKLATEFIGVFFLVFTIGISKAVLAPLAIGFILMCLIFMGGHISGAHYNPAVSVGVFLRKNLKFKELIYYCSAQVIGGIIGAAVAYGVTDTHDSPAPAAGYTIGHAFTVEMLWTFILVSVVLNVATTKAQEDNSFFGLAIGGVVLAGAIAVGPISGACFNPAVATGLSIIDGANGGNGLEYLWIYWIAPLVGSIGAAVAFRFMNAREFRQQYRPLPTMTSSSENFVPLIKPSASTSGPIRGSYT